MKFTSKTGLLTIILLTTNLCFKFRSNSKKSSPFSPFRISDSPGQKNNDIEECKEDLFQKLIPNYNVETHKVETEDGYILTVFRVNSKSDKINPNSKPPVFLQHGINDDGHCFFLGGDELGLGNLLAQNGFDVWVGNTRGSKYSREHKTLDVKSKEFWEFSFMQMGEYDVPANLAYVRKVKNFFN